MRTQRRQRRSIALAFIAVLAFVLGSSLCLAEQEENILQETSNENDSQESYKNEASDYHQNVGKMQIQGSARGSEDEGNVSQFFNRSQRQEIESSSDQESFSMNHQDDQNSANDVAAAADSEPLSSDGKKDPTGQHDIGEAIKSDPLKLLVESDEPINGDDVEDMMADQEGEPSLTSEQNSPSIDSEESSGFGSNSESEEAKVETTTNALENSTRAGDSDNLTNSKSETSTEEDTENNSLNATEADSLPLANQSSNKQERLQSLSGPDVDPDYLDLDDEISKDRPSTVTSSRSQDESKGDDETVSGNGAINHSNGLETSKSNKSEPEVETMDANLEDDVTDGIDTEPTQQSEKKHPEEESLASFFEKVKSKDKNSLSDFHDKASQTEAPAVPAATNVSSSDSSVDDEAFASRYCNIMWGVSLPTKRYADLGVLGLLFDQELAEDAKAQYRKIFDPVDLVIPTLYSKIMAGEELGDDVINATNMKAPLEDDDGTARSANAEFVEGLDDLDKFFEGVDPPDELDVGAAGTSIQEALMGQTSKIIIKRLASGGRYVVKAFKAIYRRASEFYEDEDRKMPRLNKELFAKSGKWVVARGKDGFHYLEDLFQSLFQSDEEEGFADYASDLESRLKDLTGSYSSS